MTQLASQIVLSEVDLELTVLGTLLGNPAAFESLATEISPAWFSDGLARYLFEHCANMQRNGYRLSPPAVVAALPEDCNGIHRGAFYARVVSAGLHPTMLGGLVSTMRDRWARRELVAAGDAMKSGAVQFEQDPFTLAQDMVLSLDGINASKSGSRAGSLDTGMERLMASLEAPEKLKGATTGIRALDRKLNGYKAGQLYVIAGRPGMGKSAFMCSSLRRTAGEGYGVAIFSLEMSSEEIAARCMADSLNSTTAPTFGNILKGDLGQAQKEDVLMASNSLAGLPLHIDDSPRLTFSEIMGKARNVKAKLEASGQKLAVVCIDHMGLVTPSDRYRGNKVAEAGEVSAGARALAKELNCCVILLCQLSREVEKRDDKKPNIADLRWSGEIEQDAHVVGFLYREAYYLANDPNAMPHQLTEARYNLDFLIRKNRNGETGDVRLWCSIGHSAVRDAT